MLSIESQEISSFLFRFFGLYNFVLYSLIRQHQGCITVIIWVNAIISETLRLLNLLSLHQTFVFELFLFVETDGISIWLLWFSLSLCISGYILVLRIEAYRQRLPCVQLGNDNSFLRRLLVINIILDTVGFHHNGATTNSSFRPLSILNCCVFLRLEGLGYY